MKATRRRTWRRKPRAKVYQKPDEVYSLARSSRDVALTIRHEPGAGPVADGGTRNPQVCWRRRTGRWAGAWGHAAGEGGPGRATGAVKMEGASEAVGCARRVGGLQEEGLRTG